MTEQEIKYIEGLNEVNKQVISLDYSCWLLEQMQEAVEARKKQEIDEETEGE